MMDHRHSTSQAKEIPTFHTTRLVIRPIRQSDIPAVQRNFEDYEMVRYLNGAIPWPYPKDGAEVWYRDAVVPGQGVAHWTWAICLKERTDELIGVIGIFREGRPSHRGFWLDRRFWGKKYMPEAVAVVNDYVFESLGFDKLILDNAVENIRSSNIKKNSGASLIEIVDATFVDPSITKSERWELTREAWREFRKQTS